MTQPQDERSEGEQRTLQQAVDEEIPVLREKAQSLFEQAEAELEDLQSTIDEAKRLLGPER